jgi:hypothetical protein
MSREVHVRFREGLGGEIPLGYSTGEERLEAVPSQIAGDEHHIISEFVDRVVGVSENP